VASVTGLLRSAFGSIKKALSPVSSTSSSWWPLVREPYAGAWQNGDEWKVDTVLAHHAVYACVTLIANDIGKLPVNLVGQNADGIWSKTSNPAYSPVLRKPNRYQNHIQFKQWWITSKLLRGNAYALKQRDNRGVVVGLYLLPPDHVQVLVSDSGDVFYQIRRDNLSGVDDQGLTVPASEVIHDRMNCLFHPLVGTSPLYAAGAVANLSLKIQSSSTSFFGNKGRPGGILTAPGAIGDDTARTLADYFNANFTGENAGKVAVVGDGLKFEALAITAEDSQLIEQLKWSAEVICSTFHVPPYKIGTGTMPTFNNIEALQQDYYGTCLQTLIEEFEACMDEGLKLPVDLGVELDLDVLIRMDTSTKIKTLSEAVSGSLKTINEARKSLDLPAVEGGDSIWMQQQDTSLAALYERDKNGPPPEVPPEPPEPDMTERFLAELNIKSPESLAHAI
jgi:HK97 family phage portal protein